jgi:hypothetical protein
MSHLRSRYALDVQDDKPQPGMLTVLFPNSDNECDDQGVLVADNNDDEEEDDDDDDVVQLEEGWEDAAWKVGAGVAAIMIAGYAVYRSFNTNEKKGSK